MKTPSARIVRWLALGLVALVGGCSPSCSLFTTIPSDDAGDVSFVRQAVPKLLGRKVRGTEETRLLVDVIAATPNGRGREEVLGALMHDPEFSTHWQENLVDMLRVNRSGHKAQTGCYGPPLRASSDAALADFLLARRADLAGFTGTPPSAFNMSDVLASSFAADNVFAAYSAHLFAMQSKPLQGAEANEENQRTDMAETFMHAYLHRKSECMQCHNSSFSTTGPQTYWKRAWPVFGKFEKAVFANEQGGDPAQLSSLFRTGASGGIFDDPSSAPPRTPWGALTGCGSFRSAAATVDTHGPAPHLTQPLPVGSSIWTVQSLLDDGRRSLALNGLVRSKPAACNACGTPACTGGGPAPLPEPATTDVKTLLTSKGCTGCHGGTSPAGGMNLAAANWTDNVVDQPSQRDATVLRVARGDAAASMLSRKLRGTAGSGSRMPPGGPFLSNAELTQVDNWIASLPAAGTPMACAPCSTDVCTATPSEVDGPPALAFLLAMNITDQVWAETMGAPLTIANYFPRTQAQSNVLWYLSEYTLVPNDWSVRALLQRIMLSDYFNRKSPQTTAAASPYDEPLVLDPWTEIDPRFPPVAQAGWTAASMAAPVPDPAYSAAAQPANHKNSMAEGIHRYSARSLTYSMHAALGWPAPKRFADASYPSADLTKSIGQFVRDAEPGFRDTDFQGLLTWEAQHKTCTRPVSGPDWINRLVDAVGPFNAANPGAPIRVRDLVLTMKDWFINDPQIRVDALAHDGGLLEKGLLNDFFGVPDLDTALADVSSPAARGTLEGQLREYCGVLVQSPQYWLAGIAAAGSLGPAPRLRVCNGSPCTYEEMCQQLAGGMTRAGSALQLNCSAGSVTVTERPQLRPWRDWQVICPQGQCAFWRLPIELDACIRQGDPQRCLPRQPPRFDIGCQRIDCGGGPLPPLDRSGRFAPALLLGWFEGAKIDSASGVRLLGQPGSPLPPKPLEPGQTLAVGDLIEIPRGATLSVSGARGDFKTPKGGLPMEEGQRAWYLMVTGPSVVQGRHRAVPELRWGFSVQDEAFIRAQRERLMGIGKQDQPAKRGVYDEAERNASRVVEELKEKK
ncbi:MAG: hypothetical protein AB7U92_00660 [Piscinibacter sp.]|uniref:c-type cytochrome n=1 Tax=Piscinibacter sp. TaxID=1903157 RepID=UPI003D1269AE